MTFNVKFTCSIDSGERQEGGMGGSGESVHLWAEQVSCIGDYSIEGVNVGKEAVEKSP